MDRHYFLLYKFHRIALVLHLWILILKLCSGLDLDKLPPQTEYKSCTKDADCEKNECCTFEAKATLTSSTKIVWRCKPLGNVNEMCHSLGSVHCPCRAGLRCAPKAIWYFGAGLCKEKM